MNTITNIKPILEGHFWLELPNGKIIDPHFDAYDSIIRINELTNEMCRREATPQRQKEQIKKFIIPYLQDTKTMYRLGLIKPMGGYCYVNAIIAKILFPKGTIKYGDAGWVRKDGKGVWWEFEDGWIANDKPMAKEDKEKILKNSHIARCFP